MAKKRTGDNVNNRDKILDAYSAMIIAKGIDGTSFADLSKATGLSKGTIYYYYPAKEHLNRDIAEYHFKSISDALFAWIETINDSMTIWDAIACLFESHLTDDNSYKLHFRLLNEGIIGNAELKEAFSEKYRQWVSIIEVGLMKTRDRQELAKQIATMALMLHDAYAVRISMGLSLLNFQQMQELML